LGVVVLLHGNHGTCGQGKAPRSDFGCEYTSTGTCPLGTSIVRNHDGYNYLAEELAAQGFLVLSVNANRGITCGSGLDEDWGLILARARLVLRHLEMWRQIDNGQLTKLPPPAKTDAQGAVSVAIDPNQFRNRLDFSRVGLFGHSRGGEGVRAVWPLVQEAQSPWAAALPDLRVRAVFEVGAVDGQSGREIDPDGVAWTQLLPMCDGDVSDLQGRLPYERARLKSTESWASPKALLMVWGANHNFFNTEWQENDSSGCSGHQAIFGTGIESPDQQKVLVSSVVPFFTSRLNASMPSETWMNPRLPVPAEVAKITRVERDYISTIDQLLERPAYALTEAASDLIKSGRLQVSQVDFESTFETPVTLTLRPKGHGKDRVVDLRVLSAPPNGSVSLDLRMQAARELQDGNWPAPLDLSIELVDRSGRVSQGLSLRDWVDLRGRIHSEPHFATARLPLSEFAGVQLSEVQAIRLRFDRPESADLQLADLRWSSEPAQTRFFTAFSLFNSDLALPQALASNLTPTRFISNARVTWSKKVESSPYLSGSMARELLIEPVSVSEKIPVTNELPVLLLAGKAHRVSRYQDRGLVFSLRESEWRKLPERIPARVQIGRSAGRTWRLPDLSRAELSQ
jgi:hypothetical protein